MNPSRRPASPFESLLARLAAPAWYWRVALGVAVLTVLYFALTPTPPSDMSTGWDKLNHALAFAALALAACFSAPMSPRRFVAVLVLLLGFGGAIELLQLRVPGRDAEWADLLADGVGLVGGMLTALLLRARAAMARR